MSPKERVRLNIYKTLLEEEKKKNKRKSYISISVFVIGIFAGSVYNFVPTNDVPNLDYRNVVVSDNANGKLKTNMEAIDNFFDSSSIEKEKSEIKTDEYFVMNMQA